MSEDSLRLHVNTDSLLVQRVKHGQTGPSGITRDVIISYLDIIGTFGIIIDIFEVPIIAHYDINETWSIIKNKRVWAIRRGN